MDTSTINIVTAVNPHNSFTDFLQTARNERHGIFISPLQMRPINIQPKRHAALSTWARAIVLFGALASTIEAANNYLVHNLVSDLPDVADHVDKNLVNPWGNGFSGSSPFWIGNNGTGTSTLYDGEGDAISLIVNIPGPAGSTSPGAVSGVVFNADSPSFAVATGKPASFIFCTEDGTISGWNSSVNVTNAQIMVDNSKSGAVYKGCTLGGTSAAPMLYAANFGLARVDVWDGNMNPVTSAAAFVDSAVPAGFGPFNIQNMGGKLYVLYAKKEAQGIDDVPGAGNGYLAVYDYSGNLQSTLISQGALNSPWGMAIAPATFGDFAGDMLVSNFGDGKINAFDPTTGALMGTLSDLMGNAISIPGIWSINFGNGGKGGDTSTLYFTAGISGYGEPVESHGLFGSIQPAPSFQTSGVVNGASFTAAIASNSWVSIKGGALSATTRSWASSDFSGDTLPTQLDGVGVTVNGEAAPVSYISPTQINILIPGTITPGPLQLVATNNGLTSATVSATLSTFAPSFFTIGTNSTTKNLYIAATHANNSLVGPPSLISGVTTTPATTGETIILYGTGFGSTAPGFTGSTTVAAPLPLAALPTVTIGGIAAQVTFGGLVGPGLYQINVVIPSGITPGTTANIDVPVVAQEGSDSSPSNTVISLVNPSQ